MAHPGGELAEPAVGPRVHLDAVQHEDDAAGREELEVRRRDGVERDDVRVPEVGRQRVAHQARAHVVAGAVHAVLDVHAVAEARLLHLGTADRNLRHHGRCVTVDAPTIIIIDRIFIYN